MTRSRLQPALLVACGLLMVAPEARAQFSPFDPGFNIDPFSAYHGYYLPRTQAIAAQRRFSSFEQINQNAADRRASAFARETEPMFDLSDPSALLAPLEERPFVRGPTVLIPGQMQTSPVSNRYFGRSSPHYYSAPGTVIGATSGQRGAARIPSTRPMRGMGGMGGMGMPGMGMPGMGMGMRMW